MKTLLAIILSQALWSVAQADTIVIRDTKNGTIVAELNIDAEGPKFIHAGRTLTIQRKAPVMELRARKLVWPRIAFAEAPLDGIADFLRRPYPPGGEAGRPPRPTINLVIDDQAKRNLRVSIYLEQVSLFDLLQSFAQKYDLKVAYDDHTITLIDPKPSE